MSRVAPEEFNDKEKLLNDQQFELKSPMSEPENINNNNTIINNDFYGENENEEKQSEIELPPIYLPNQVNWQEEQKQYEQSTNSSTKRRKSSEIKVQPVINNFSSVPSNLSPISPPNSSTTPSSSSVSHPSATASITAVTPIIPVKQKIITSPINEKSSSQQKLFQQQHHHFQPRANVIHQQQPLLDMSITQLRKQKEDEQQAEKKEEAKKLTAEQKQREAKERVDLTLRLIILVVLLAGITLALVFPMISRTHYTSISLDFSYPISISTTDCSVIVTSQSSAQYLSSQSSIILQISQHREHDDETISGGGNVWSIRKSETDSEDTCQISMAVAPNVRLAGLNMTINNRRRKQIEISNLDLMYGSFYLQAKSYNLLLANITSQTLSMNLDDGSIAMQNVSWSNSANVLTDSTDVEITAYKPLLLDSTNPVGVTCLFAGYVQELTAVQSADCIAPAIYNSTGGLIKAAVQTNCTHSTLICPTSPFNLTSQTINTDCTTFSASRMSIVTKGGRLGVTVGQYGQQVRHQSKEYCV